MPRSKFFLNPYLVFELVLVLASFSIKKEKKLRGVAMVVILSSHQQKRHGKYSQCPAFDIKQSPAGRSSEDRQSKSHGEINI